MNNKEFSPQPPSRTNKISLSLLLLVVGFLLGAGLVFVYFQFGSNRQPSEAPTPETKMTKTGLLGRGLFFEYPEGWHLSFDGLNTAKREPYQGYDVLYIGSRPVSLSLMGFGCDFVFYIENSFEDPENEFNRILEYERKKDKNELIDYKEEVIPSQYFGEIYHLTGMSQPSEMYESLKIEKYLFITSNEEPLNRTIIVAELVFDRDEKSPVLGEIIASFEECEETVEECLGESQ